MLEELDMGGVRRLFKQASTCFNSMELWDALRAPYASKV